MVRLKNRYIVVEINPEHIPQNFESYVVPSEAIFSSINSKIQQLHGDFGIAAIKAGFIIKYCNPKLRLALIRVRHGPHKLMLSVLPFVDKIAGKIATIRVLYVGATMRNCFKFLINHQKQEINRQLTKIKGTALYDEMSKEFGALAGLQGIY